MSQARNLIPMISKIEDGLFIGDIRSAKNIKILKYNHISNIISSTTFEDENWYDDITQTFMCVADHESDNISQYFTAVWNIVNKCKSNGIVTLIHCHAGISRSATLTIAYIMRSRGIGYDDAFIEVRNKRRCIVPNDGFVRQLREYEKELKRNGILHNINQSHVTT